MFCAKCGAENDNGAKFCRGCGNPLGNGGAPKAAAPSQVNQAQAPAQAAPAANAAAPVNNVAAPQFNTGEMADKLKSVPVAVWAGIAAAVVALIVIICVAVSASGTINLNKYVTIETSGYDGYGTARAVIDWDAIGMKYGSKVSFTSVARKELGGFISMTTPMDELEDAVSIQLDERKGLSNGSVVKYTFEIDEDLQKYVKCKLKYKEGQYVVAGLTKVGTFDAFEGLTVEYGGIAPNGYANLNYVGSNANYYDFNCDKTSGLSNGDTITVTIPEDRVEYYAENVGKIPEELEKTFTVSGLESYLAKASEIDSESLAEMQQQASDVYNAYIAKNWGDGEEMETFTYLGNYLLTAKNSDSWGTSNYLYLVYKVQVHNTFSNKEAKYDQMNSVYWYIRFDNLMVGSDGKLVVNLTSYSTPGERFTVESGLRDGWWDKNWYYYGYESLDDLYKNTVMKSMDSYNHEDNVNEDAAPVNVAEKKEEKKTDSSGYILPDSDKKLLTKDDLEGLDAEDCKIARNEIYARHGRKFNDKKLQAHFDGCDWYSGTIEPDDFKEKDLSDIEISNKDLIVAYEEEKGYR